MKYIVGNKEVSERDFYSELAKHINANCPIKQRFKSLLTAKESLMVGKSVTIEGTQFIIKNK